MEVSFCSSNITPPYPCWLTGYERSSKSEGVLDPIYLQSFAWKIKDDLLLFFTLDCICVTTAFCEELQELISTQYDIAKEHINIGCIHTHSAPAICALPTTPAALEETLWQSVVRKTMLADCKHCLQTLTPAALSYEAFSIDGCYGNRNTLDGPCDKEVTLLSFQHQAKHIGLIALIGVHPTILHQDNNRISADLLGALRQKLSDHVQAPVMIWNSACGNVSTRFYRMDEEENPLQATAQQIYQQLSLPAGKQITIDEVKSTSFTIHTDFNANQDLWTQTQLQQLKVKQQENANFLEKNLLHRLELKQQLHTIHSSLTIHLYLLGKLLLVTVPGEIIAQAALELKQRYPQKQVLLIAYCNGYHSYLVNQEEYGKYFESYVAITPKYTYERVMDAVIQSIETLDHAI